MPRRGTQLELRAHTHGGRRAGAGRKPGARRRVPHRRRPHHQKRNALHVTVRVRDGLPSLRTTSLMRVIRRCIAAGHKDWFRVVQFAVLGNHMHFIVEADDRIRLARGMAGLKIRIAKNLNKALGRRGPLFAERYHVRALTTPAETRAALQYLLCNARRHAAQQGRKLARDWLDPCSSAPTFDGWIDRIDQRLDPQAALITRLPQTWLLRHGWRMRGRLDPNVVPGAT
jgi:REP element-mobilizing transposase RayT